VAKAFSVRVQAEPGDLADVRRKVERRESLFSARLYVDGIQLPLSVIRSGVLEDPDDLLPTLGKSVRRKFARRHGAT
jgi:hypothetical protein